MPKRGIVDFAKVIEHAGREGIPLTELPILYDGLTPEDLAELESRQEVTHRLGPGKVIARFPTEGMPAFPEKAVAILYLAS